MNATETLTDPLNWVAAVAMVANAIFGVFCNSMIVFIFVKSSSDRTSFNLISAYRALGNLFILTFGFLITFVPITIFGDNTFPQIYQYLIITTVNSLYMSLQYCEILVGINRFFAMYIPFIYSKVFTLKLTFLIVFIIFAYRISKIYTEASVDIPLECFTTFSAYDLAWGPNMNARCRQKSGDGIVSGTAVFLAVLVILNLLTFTKIWLFYKSTQESDLDGKKKMKKNRMLFLQTIVQDMLYMIDMLFTYQLGGLVDERYWTFISGSFVWESVHSCDGLIMIMFNERLTFLRKSLFATSATPSTVAVISKHPPSGPARNAMSRVDISS